jgi:hypothetical protein
VSEVYFVRLYYLPFYHLAPVLLHSLLPLDLQCKNIGQGNSKIVKVGQIFCPIWEILVIILKQFKLQEHNYCFLIYLE